MRTAGWTALAMATLAAPQALAAEAPAQASLDRLADTLGYRLTMVDKRPTCPAGIDGCFLSTITLNELTGSAQIVVSETFRPFEVYVVLLVVYAALTYLLSLAIAYLHRRLNRDMTEAVA